MTSGAWFDVVLAAALAVVSLSVGLKGIRERSRKHLIAAGAGLLMAALLAFMRRDVIWPG